MLSAESITPMAAAHPPFDEIDDEPSLGLADVMIWLGEKKKTVAFVTVAAALVSLGVALLMTPIYTAHTTLLAPGTQQQSGGAAALAALGALGSLAGSGGGIGAKSPDELYVSLLRSDSVRLGLADRFDLRNHYRVSDDAALRRAMAEVIRVSSDKKSGVLMVEVDDPDPKFAADVANGHLTEVTKLLGRLAVSEAQQRRVFFEKQLGDTKESLIKAEQALRVVQEQSGVIVLDKQAEALIYSAASLRAQVSEREVQLKVMRGSATEQNPDVIRLNSELRALRSELARMESSQAGNTGSAIDLPVGRLPEAAIEYVRARRELKLQETLLESMVRQYEIAKLDEAKEGPALQQVDVAVRPDHKAKPSRGLIVLSSTLIAFLLVSAWVVVRRYAALVRRVDPGSAEAWRGVRQAWGLRRS